MVDIAPPDPDADPVRDAKAIVEELRKYDPTLYDKPRWLVLNKLDLVPEDEGEARVKSFLKALRWKGPYYSIAAISGTGCEALTYGVMEWLDAHRATTAAPDLTE